MEFEPLQLLFYLSIVHVYLLTRFAVQCCFKYADVYSFKYILLVLLVPVAGYFVAINQLEKQLPDLETE
jgi:hypothetical protein